MAAATGQAPTAGEYIIHHLHHLQVGTGFWTFNLDSIFWSVAMGLVGCSVLWLVAKGVTSGVPGRLQAAVEFLVEMVDTQAKGIVHNAQSRKLVAPLALTVFIWIVLMNAMDFLPLDLLPKLWELYYSATGRDPHHAYLRVVPTADLNGTLSLAIVILFSTIYYGIKIKHPGGFVHELFSAPFGSGIALAPFNFLLQLIEYAARCVSLGMRLFGNMFAGELVFMLIALLGATATAWGFGLHFLLGLGWSIFHILIVVLQGFIFMMLTLVYLGQAHEGH